MIEKMLVTKIMKRAKVLSLPRSPICMVLDHWSPPGWMEIIYYTVRMPDGSLMDQVRPEEIKFLNK